MDCNRLRHMAVWLIILLLACVLGSCGKVPSDARENPVYQTAAESTGTDVNTIPASSEIPQSYPVPMENRLSGREGVASTTADGYYAGSPAVRFYDRESRTSMFLCAQPGCTHTDSTCQAWMGQVVNFAECGGQIYAVVRDDGMGVHFICKDLASGAITILDTWEHVQNEERMEWSNVYVLLVSDGQAVLREDRTILNLLSVSQEEYQKEESHIWLWDLEAGKKRELFLDGGAILALSGEYALVQTSDESGILSPEEFKNKYGEEASYGRYSDWATVSELRLYDLSDDTYTCLVNSQQDAYHATVDPNGTYGNQVAYQCGDAFWVFDLDTRESRKVLTMDKVINYWLMDGKLFLIRDTNFSTVDFIVGEGGLSVYYADLKDGIPVRLENGGNTSYMEFAISWEGDSFFVGLWKGSSYIIDKADFYSGKYENAQVGGY